MHVRLTGTDTELDQMLPVLREALDVVEESRRYPNRGNSRLSRVYLEVQPSPERGTDNRK